MDLSYSGYLLRKKDGEEEEDSDNQLSPTSRECQQAIFKAISSRGKSGQRKTVLSFTLSTPSMAEGIRRMYIHVYIMH